MSDLNRVLIEGRLTRDPEDRSKNGSQMASISIAVNRKYRNRNGENVEETAFVDTTLFGKQAEVALRMLQKGRRIRLEGELRTDKWTDKQTGKSVSRLAFHASSFDFLSDGMGKDGGGNGGGGDGNYSNNGGGYQGNGGNKNRNNGGGNGNSRNGGGGGGNYSNNGGGYQGGGNSRSGGGNPRNDNGYQGNGGGGGDYQDNGGNFDDEIPF